MRVKGDGLAGFCFTILILGADLSEGKALQPEDVDSLLPATPQTANDTLAAIVQDPVVKDAVQYAVGNGSLSGLVVKKNIVILPADSPDTILTHAEQILTVPPAHLEDIRKNITEEAKTEANGTIDSTQATYLNRWTSKDDYTELESESDKSEISPQESADALTPLPEGVVTEKLKLPAAIEDKVSVSVPVVAVLDPSKIVDNKIESSIVALFPNYAETSSMGNRVENTESNSEEFFIPQLDLRWENNEQVLKNADDMDVAEDIVFRPLFRYRQETQRKANYDDRRSYGRRYNSYQPYDNYNSYRKQYYRNRQEYYDDYE